jgi:hypothetical protein
MEKVTLTKSGYWVYKDMPMVKDLRVDVIKRDNDDFVPIDTVIKFTLEGSWYIDWKFDSEKERDEVFNQIKEILLEDDGKWRGM